MIGRLITPARLWLVAAIVAASSLLGLIIAESSKPGKPRISAADTAAAPTVAKASPPPQVERPPFDRFQASLKRPLFHPGRRPLPERPPLAPPPVVEALPPPPVAFKLRGAIITPESRMAILEGGEANESLRLAEGEDLKGWTLASIEARRATFKLRDQTFVLELAVRETGE